MSNFASKGIRALKLQKRKEAIFALNNFAEIITNMNKLSEYIESHKGLITKENIKEIATRYNKTYRLSLTEDQENIVIKPYL